MDSMPIKVYMQIDAEGHIILPLVSSIFLRDSTGWTQVDEGYGDRYAHCQSQYLPKPIRDAHGRYNYSLVDGRPEEIPEAEKPPVPAFPPSQAEIIADLQAQDEILIATLDAVIFDILPGLPG